MMRVAADTATEKDLDACRLGKQPCHDILSMIHIMIEARFGEIAIRKRHQASEVLVLAEMERCPALYLGCMT